MSNASLLDHFAIDLTHAQDTTLHELANHVSDWMVETTSERATNSFERVLTNQPQDVSNSVETTHIRHAVLVGTIRRLRANATFDLSKNSIALLRESYFSANVGFDAYRSLLLRTLIAANTAHASATFADLIVSHPPSVRMSVEIFGDLIKSQGNLAEAMFPRLLDGLDDLDLASFVLDFANFVFRSNFITPHPATDRVPKLIALLSNLAERLAVLQDTPPQNNNDATKIGKQVTQAISLAVPLCDALACIGDPLATASLNKALQVEHRRLRVEAAAALAKLGVEDAKLLLVAMASEPGERLRVLNYAEELDILCDVDEQYSNIVARAEAEFVTYLSQPSQFGVAPQYVELLDQRELAWPGYDEPRNCYLFQFVYRFATGEYTNIGIAGPLVKAIQADLTHLVADDVYALFAGWHVDHPDILAIPAERTVGQDQQYLARMNRSLEGAEDYHQVHPVLLGKLMDRAAMIASAQRQSPESSDHFAGWLLVTEDEISWVDAGSVQSPLGAEEVFYLYVGRSLLRSFN